jgi:hypothetical protein
LKEERFGKSTLESGQEAAEVRFQGPDADTRWAQGHSPQAPRRAFGKCSLTAEELILYKEFKQWH